MDPGSVLYNIAFKILVRPRLAPADELHREENQNAYMINDRIIGTFVDFVKLKLRKADSSEFSYKLSYFK